MSTSFFSAEQSASQHALRGVALTGGRRVAIHRDPVFAWAPDPSLDRQVAIVSGGGAGHEPMHAGFIGRGGLDAAAPGEVFTSPHSRQIHDASLQVARPGGVIHVVKNYTGDRINFAIAAERLRADGIPVEEVLVDDDLGSDGQAVGRRGTGATVVVEKILGAAADRGLGIDELAALGRRVVERSRSLAVAHRAHTAPGADGPAFDVEAGQLEYGVGIHGEAARESIVRPSLSELVDRMVGELLDALPATGDGVIVLVNGLGGTGNLELLHVLTEVERALGDRGVPLRSAVSGTYVSALDMAGFSITVTAIDEDWLADWTAPHDTASLPTPVLADAADEPAPAASSSPAEASPWLVSVASDIAALRDHLNALDQRAGDGDMGTNIDAGLSAALRRAGGADAGLADDLESIASAFLEDVGGSSGPLFGLVLGRVAAAVRADEENPAAAVARGLREGVAAVSRAGGAKRGDRTMLDALGPCAWDGDDERAVVDSEALHAAAEGAASTSDMIGRRGRSSYLGDRALGAPDPGAVAVVAVLTAVVEHVTGTRETDVRARIEELVRA
jgi:dihydroxyacetone kinase